MSEMQLDNVQVMVPFVRTEKELLDVRRLLVHWGFVCPTLMMCELPVNCLRAPQVC